MFKRLAHVCIGADDLAASENFYCNLLGMQKVFDFEKDSKPFGFYANAGDTTYIEVFIQSEVANLDRPIMKHFCLEVEDLDAVIAHCESKGITVSEKKQGADLSWQAWITDPSGVAIELMQYTPDSSQFTGRTVIANW